MVRKTASISTLSERDRQTYQDIMEAVVANHGVSHSDIMELVEKRKKEMEDQTKDSNK